MIPLTPEQIAYKEKTLHQLRANLPALEAELAQETRPDVLHRLQDQFDAVQLHIDRLQGELSAGVAGEPVADELCRRVARALTREKFVLAKKHLEKLEAIEPFYPGLDRLRREVEAEQASRRMRSIAQGTAPPFGAATFPAGAPVGPTETMATGQEGETMVAASETTMVRPPGAEKRSVRQFFQFHVLVSCLLIMIILCVMGSVGAVMLLQWLVEGA